jgi:hypothetical protein
MGRFKMKRFAPSHVFFSDCRHASRGIDQAILPITVDTVGAQFCARDALAATDETGYRQISITRPANCKGITGNLKRSTRPF